LSDRDDLYRLVTEAVVRALEEEGRDARRKSAKSATVPAKDAPRRELPALQHERGPRWLRSHSGSMPRRRDRDDRSGDEAHWGLRDLPPPPDVPIHVENPRNPEALRKYVRSTPSRIGVGRTGTRYLTDIYVALRADHAVAKDAVEAALPESLAASLGALSLRTQCTDRQDFLLYPDRGRVLDDASLQLLQREGTRGADVQVIVGDGLSSWAVEENAPPLVPLLHDALHAAGWSTGKLLVVRFARVGVQDQIGVTLGNKATIILVGERPGLGTGDSMSVYIAYAPRLAQDNAEKNCISNVRRRGIQTEEAAHHSVEILKKAFAAGRGGIVAE